MRTFCFMMCLGVSAVVAGDDEPLHYSFRYHTSYGSPETMHAMTFSPDSRQLAVSVSDHVDFIDTQDGEILYQFKASPFSLRYTQDGKRLYMISRFESQLLDVQSGVVWPTQYQPVMAGLGINLEVHNGKLLIKSMVRGGSAAAGEALQVGDELVAFSEGQNGEMRRTTGWSLESATEALQGYAGTFARVTVLSRGSFGAKNEKTFTLRRTTGTHSGRSGNDPLTGQNALPKSLAWCMVDSQWHEFRDAATGNPVAHLETIDIRNVGRYAISPDESKFAVVASRKDREGNAVEVYDLASQVRLAFIPLSTTSFIEITFAADNNRVLVGTWDTVEVCDTAKAAVVSRMTLGYQMPKKDDSYRISGSIASQAMNEVRAQIADGSEGRVRSPRQLVGLLAASVRNVVAVGDLNGNVGIWDLNSGEHVHSIPAEQDEPVEQLAFSPDGRWLAYYVGGSLHLEDVSKAQVRDNETTPSQNNADESFAGDRISTISPE